MVDLPRRRLLGSLLLTLAFGAQAGLDEESGINPRYLLIGPRQQAVSTETFQGRFQLIAFGYTFCPDICPTTLSEMAAILKQLGPAADKIQGIFISVDPERDTPAALSTYTAFFDARIIGLTGSAELVRQAARHFKVRYVRVPAADKNPKHYAVDHSSGLYLLGPDGDFIKKFGFGTSVDEIVETLQPLLAQHRVGR